MKFYNYVYLDPRKPGHYSYEDLNLSFLFEPFYVGKGTRNRLYDHLKEARTKKRSLKINKIKAIFRENHNLKSHIIQINSRLSSKEAYSEEVHLIKAIGRISLKTGPLTNMSMGGEGVRVPFKGPSSIKGIPKTARHRELIRASWTNEMKEKAAERLALRNKNDIAQRERTSKRVSGKNNPACRSDVRSKISAAKKGKIPANLDYIHRDENVHKKISESLKGRKIPQEVIDRSTASKKNSVWVHLNSQTKMVQKELLEHFLNSGWKRGRKL